MLKVRALRTGLVGPIDLSVAATECVAIRGPSGSGKSLMLRAIADLDPNEGRLSLKGAPREAMPAHVWRRRVAMVPAESGWWSERVGDHFETGADIAGLLQAAGLPEALDWQVARLSSGERHRLAILRALALDPEVILLDEPTATLDAAAAARIEALLRARCAQGAAMVVVTHDPGQPDRLNARPLWMEAGRLSAAPAEAPA